MKILNNNINRIVVKVGTTSLTDDGGISENKIKLLVDDIASVREKGYEVILVTSGAITAGARELGMKKELLTIPQKQALAAIGQTLLMNEYRKQFAKKGIKVGQLLLTEDDVKNRKRFLNARNTFNALLQMKVLPIVNENDSVAVSEIKIGDNDTLSAHVASLTDSQLLILLSDIDGFYWDLSDPKPVESIDRITNEVVKRAGGSGSIHGSGGMITKIRAADMMLKCGEKMIIAKGGERNIIGRIISGEKLGTLFAGSNKKMPSRKKWLAMSKAKGIIFIDDGACEALIKGKKSLLPSGIVKIEGSFDVASPVDICDINGNIIAKGLSNYSQTELELIKGKSTKEIETIMGYKYMDEAVHRDNIIVF